MPVVNCKVKYIRPEYDNLKQWMDDNDNVYIGRAGIVFIYNDKTKSKERYPKKSSIFANPYKLKKYGKREDVIEKYREYIIEKLKEDKKLKRKLLKLKGKNLGCWCHPEPCHGDVLLELIEKIENKEL
jgi:hypothetical protein